MSGCISPMNIKSPLYICKIHLYLHIKKKLSYIIFTCGIKQILNSEAWGLGVGISITSVHFSHIQLFATPWTTPHQGSLSITNSGACSNSCPSSQWCHPTFSSSVIPFSFCLQSSPASESLPVSQLLASGGQSIGASASASVLPMNIQD